MAGPAVEPYMSADQAARAGGSCGPYIRRASRHLEADLEEGAGIGDLWQDMLGIHRVIIDEHTRQHLEECARADSEARTYRTLAKEAAILFADQRQAFERFAIRWIPAGTRGTALSRVGTERFLGTN